MDNRKSTPFSITPETEHVIPRARHERYLLTRIELKYKYKTNSLNVGGTAVEMKSYALTNAYYDMLENQLHNLKKLIAPTVHALKTNFTMQIDIDDKGMFNLDLVKIRIKLDFPRPLNKVSVKKIFAVPFKVLSPFADYTNSLSVRGHNYNLSVIEADLILSLEDFIEVVKYPIIGPRIETQWTSFATQVSREGKKQYQLNVTIPCVDGELIWDIKEKEVFIQHLEKF